MREIPGRTLWWDALRCELVTEPLPPEQVVQGAPHVGHQTFFEDDRGECGVWEMTPGVATDVEGEETFVVLAGDAVLTRHTGHLRGDLVLRPGMVVALEQGEETTWAVTSTLRKVYWAKKSS